MTSALELTQRSIIAGAVRLVYAIIYTFFLVRTSTIYVCLSSSDQQGFSMTIGSDVFLLFYPKGNALTDFATNAATLDFVHGILTAPADKNSGHAVNFTATFGFKNETLAVATAKGKRTRTFTSSMQRTDTKEACFRGPEWPWPLLPSLHWPWWRYLFLVPAYATAISLANLQSYRSWRILVMIGFACVAYLVNFFAHRLVGGPQIDVASALAAAALGTMGNIQSRIFGGTAFTSMVPGVLFLVPVSLQSILGVNHDLRHFIVGPRARRWPRRELVRADLRQFRTGDAYDQRRHRRDDWSFRQPDHRLRCRS